jgi:radical SAM superfamily enzyme with C-terminal helix-hairpin-helix motif
MTKVIILDGYVDEPTCLGVPPYISPYPRYIAGAIWSVDPSITIQYLTIDHIRNNHGMVSTLESSDLIIAIAGVSVPGKYLATYPMSLREAITIFSKIHTPQKILCGPAAKLGYGSHGGKKPHEFARFNDIFDLIISGDCEIFFNKFFKKNDSIDAISPSILRSNAHQIHTFSLQGAKIVTQHPYFPNRLLAEIETYRGCPRTVVGGCSFCSEPRKGSPDFRPINDIVSEVKVLYENQIRHIRLGNQPCIFSYLSKDARSKEFPTPNPRAIETLFRNIRQVAPDLKTFHVDNANPGVISHHPEESKQIAQHIISYHTSGDVAAFGVESTDPKVIQENNLKATGEQVLNAIKILNDVGAIRGRNGLPELLPGLNFLFGLPGERKQTFSLNLDFLKTLLKKGLLVRRINIRQVIPLPQSGIDEKACSKIIKKHHSYFIKFKDTVSHEINAPLLKKMIPIGTVLKDVIIEKQNGKIWFGRQMGSYPLLIGVIAPVTLHDCIDVTVVNHGFRSVTAVPHPLNLNTATLNTLQTLPMVGKKRAMRLIRNRPYSSAEDILPAFDDINVGKQLIELITFIT